MVTQTRKMNKKPSERAREQAPPERRPRGHTLAPAHLGEAGSVVMLVLIILGLAVFIAGVAMIASGFTMGGRFTGTTPPPNVDELGRGQVFGGIGLLLLGALQAGSALALLGEVRGARRFCMLVAVGSAVLGVAGVIVVMTQEVTTPLLPGALAVATVIYAASAIILARPHR